MLQMRNIILFQIQRSFFISMAFSDFFWKILYMLNIFQVCIKDLHWDTWPQSLSIIHHFFYFYKRILPRSNLIALLEHWSLSQGCHHCSTFACLHNIELLLFKSPLLYSFLECNSLALNQHVQRTVSFDELNV